MTPRSPLSPRLLDRLPALSPRLTSPTSRRVIASLLVVLALVAAVRPDPDRRTVTVVTATVDLTPGVVVTADQVQMTAVEDDGAPTAPLTDLADAVDRTVAGPVRAGEILTDVRLLGPELAAAGTTDDDARIVPVRLADPSVADVLRIGDVVDVVRGAGDVSGGDLPSTPDVLADNALVVLASEAGTGTSRRDRVVLVALPAAAATRVAAASLTDALTVVVR
ncbi:SAF domain-containing protein [Rhodococcoides kroppenstedtii]|uniref:SAF domain-containing protein n=1 Tax=Rhodococcoides kroppenstedtii TaxID=293050 RepID=UPI001BDE2EFD|nr:SAF domain-containing protein [Rhodococcus kroppenstedtii]MBT1193652.1 flagellar biosynthesis protein FlgA [Rhodococcus kroppenstedtii]